MSPGAEDSEGGIARGGTGFAPPARASASTSASTSAATSASAELHRTNGAPNPARHHHVLIDPEEDRWRWRRRIRSNPHRLRIYRVGVGLAGLVLLCLGLVTGPLPGPGGIPLVLLGLAIWSSEFEWAYRLRQRFKVEIKKFHGWSTRKKILFWIVFFAVCGAFAYCYLLVLGVPFWMPDAGATLLEHLPWIHEQR